MKIAIAGLPRGGRCHHPSTASVELAGDGNTALPTPEVNCAREAWKVAWKSGRGNRIALLSVAYRPKADAHFKSPDDALLALVKAQDAKFDRHDGHTPVVCHACVHHRWTRTNPAAN